MNIFAFSLKCEHYVHTFEHVHMQPRTAPASSARKLTLRQSACMPMSLIDYCVTIDDHGRLVLHSHAD